jgi:hypothetical protein
MKLIVTKSIFVVLVIFTLLACSVNPSGQSDVVSIEVTKTAEADIQIETVTLPPTNTPNPNLIYSNSPDNKYAIELELSETPVTLTILENTSKQKTQISISYRYYNKIVGDGSVGFKWSTDNKILMFVLYREPSSEKREADFSCFFAINVEQGKPITTNYSSLFRGLWYQDESGIAMLEHGGLNDIYDFYLSGTNCYKNTLESECESSYVSPSGNWEFSQWEENSNATLTNLTGGVWQYSYPETIGEFGYLITFVQRWTDDERYVLFSPANGYGTSRVYGLFQMDLSNGNVISLLGNSTIDQPYYLSVSPSATKVIYITSDRKALIKDLSKNSEKSFNISFGDEEAIANFIWSPDETMIVFAKLKFDKENEIVSADYLRLDTATGDLITFLSGEPKYLSIIKMTNSEVSFKQDTYSLVYGTILK